MKTNFKGFSPEGLKFLTQLVKHNDREWFAPRKHIFEEQLRLPMIELVRDIHCEMLRFAPEYVGEPAKCVYRIYRDTRFSKDKTPYKDHVAALFWRNDLTKGEGAAFYFGISPKCVEIAGGLYHPEPASLLAVRQHVAEEPEEFRATYTSRRIQKLLGPLRGESTARVPKGFSPQHPAIDLIRQKQYLLWTELEPSAAASPKLYKEVVDRFALLTPFVSFLNAPLIKPKNVFC